MMHEISTAEIRVSDVGNRVVVIDDGGNAYSGIVTNVTANSWKYGKRDEEMVRISLTVSNSEQSELKLASLPLDFRLQIERPNQSGGAS